MLIRKENEVEIWTDPIEKGKGKKYILAGFASVILFFALAIMAQFNFNVIETYIFCFLPGSLFFITAAIYRSAEKKPAVMEAKVNQDFIEIYTKKESKKIWLNSITKINKVISSLGSFIVVFYYENDKETKYSIEVSSANRNLFIIAIKEYKRDIPIEEVLTK